MLREGAIFYPPIPSLMVGKMVRGKKGKSFTYLNAPIESITY